jgi:hypothetical protein
VPVVTISIIYRIVRRESIDTKMGSMPHNPSAKLTGMAKDD